MPIGPILVGIVGTAMERVNKRSCYLSILYIPALRTAQLFAPGTRYTSRMLRRVVDSPWFLWLLLALPGAVTVVRYATGATFYGEVVHVTGELSARLLIATMAVTPLQLMFPGRGWVRWLLRRRRYLGVASFGYAALHTVVYLVRTGVFGDILVDAAEPGLLTGWLALAIFVPLAITSNDRAVRRLRRLWKRLHRWVYAAAILTFAHWVLTAFDPVPGLIHLAILAALEGYRLWRTYRLKYASD